MSTRHSLVSHLSPSTCTKLVLAVAVCSGCRSAPSSSPPVASLDNAIVASLEVVTASALPTCSAKIAGETAVVTATATVERCVGTAWSVVSCTAALGGTVIYSSASQSIWACANNVDGGAPHWAQVSAPQGATGATGATGTTGAIDATGATGATGTGTCTSVNYASLLPNLQGCNLAGAALSGVNFANANLEGADLAGAILTSATLAGANLLGANLTGANLTNATIAGANVTEANLTDATLQGLASGALIGQPAALPQDWFWSDSYLVGPGRTFPARISTGSPFSVTNTWLASICQGPTSEPADCKGRTSPGRTSRMQT